MPSYPRPTRVPPTPLSAVASRVDATLQGDASITVTGVTLVSADVRPGDLYAAVPGARRHGAEFVSAAVGAGAVAVLTDPAGARMLDTEVPVLVVDDPRAALGSVSALVYGEPSGSLTVLGVTGTAGKTSTVYLLEAGLRAAGVAAGLIGTVETRLGDLVVDSARTTPEAPDLHALFAAAVERGIKAVAMEVSSHALSLGRVSGVRFAVGGFTNFGLDHLDFHPDVDDYFAAKARLFDGRSAVEVINLDDPALKGLIHSGTVTYSAAGDPAATWRAADVTGSGYAQTFTAVGPSGAVSAGVSLPGRHNVANALLAIATLAAAGVDPQVAANGVASCPGVPGRMERVGQIGPVLGVVDYAHKPDAIRAVLAALREVADASGGRIICVLGAGGDRDQGKRPVMGEAAAAGADLLIVTDDNPRTEDPARIRAQVLAGAVTGETASGKDRSSRGALSRADKYLEIAGRRDAIAEAVRRARPGDVVALLGKGHERGQEVGGEVLPFDDRVELAAALAARPDANISGAGVAQ